MDLHTHVTDHMLRTVQRMHGCDLSSGQTFLEVDRLSGEGEVLVTLGTGGRYMIWLPDHSRIPETHYVRS
jgi:hypothetical protein